MDEPLPGPEKGVEPMDAVLYTEQVPVAKLTQFVNQNMHRQCILRWDGPEDGRLYNSLTGQLHKVPGSSAWELQDKYLQRLYYRFGPAVIDHAYLSNAGDLVLELRGEYYHAPKNKY